jgi:hypothetical protein
LAASLKRAALWSWAGVCDAPCAPQHGFTDTLVHPPSHPFPIPLLWPPNLCLRLWIPPKTKLQGLHGGEGDARGCSTTTPQPSQDRRKQRGGRPQQRKGGAL